MSGPLRILYHHRTQGRGAEGNHIVSIVTALRSLGHTVDVLSPPGVDPFDPASSVPVDKATTQTRGWSSLWKLLSRRLPNWLFEIAEMLYNIPEAGRVRGALRAGRYDLVFERYAFFMLAGARAAHSAGCSFLLEANEVSGIPGRARRQSFPRLCAAMERRLIRRCTLAHAVSSYLGDRLVDAGLDRSRLAVVPNGFDVGRLKLHEDRDSMRRKLGFSADAIVIGFAGWFDHWDRLDLLLEAFGELRRRFPQCRLCLVGAGPADGELRQKAAAMPCAADVLMTGAVARSAVYDHIQTFDIGILPHSNVFGSPIVMFEMMALRIPLVLPRLPPIVDVHGDGGGDAPTALLFEPLDQAGCLDALARLVQSGSLRRDVAQRAYDKLLREHTWRQTAQRILTAWESRR